MLTGSNTLGASDFDKLLEMANINDMLDTTNSTAGRIAIRYLEALAKATNLTQETLATKLHICRQTIAKRFKDGQMDIDAYIDTAKAIGADPVDILDQAIKQATALADSKEGEER